MASALYHPYHGFYSKGPSIGCPQGDFNTNAMFRAFAFALARAIKQAEEYIDGPLRILEFGGGTGELGENITSFLGSSIEYIIIETSPNLREQQKMRGLTSFDRIEALQPAPTFVFGNEVLDALPVHRVMNDGLGKLTEMYVGLDGQGEFCEQPGPPSTPHLAQRLDDEGIGLGRGQVAEICLDLQGFLQDIQKIISTGYLVFIDYGDEAADLYTYTQRNGTLRSYRFQQRTFDPFDGVGEQDLTTDVDFSALRKAAQDAGFISAGKIKQGPWLKNLGIGEYLKTVENDQQAQNDLEQLTSMAQLGSTFDIHMFKTEGLPDGPGLHPLI